MSNWKNKSVHFLPEVLLLIIWAVLLLDVVIPLIPFLRTNGETQVVLFASNAEIQQQKPIPTFAEVEPIFQERCIICHNGAGAPKKLQLTSYELILKGSVNGPVVKPGNPEESELIKRLKGISLPRMPLTGPPWLSDQEIQLMEQWIINGALNAPANSLPTTSSRPARLTPQEALQKDIITYTDVETIFRIRCMKCHNTRGLMGSAPEGFLLNSYENILDSRDRARVIPEHPDASELVRRIRGQALPRMPYDGPPYLSEDEIKLIEEWIARGAKDASGASAPIPEGARVRLHGRLTAPWQLDGLRLQPADHVRIKKSPRVGDYVRVRGIVKNHGNILVERIRKR